MNIIKLNNIKINPMKYFNNQIKKIKIDMNKLKNKSRF